MSWLASFLSAYSTAIALVLGTLWLVWDLARRLWHPRVALAAAQCFAALGGCATMSPDAGSTTPPAPVSSNPLLQPWPKGAFDGVAHLVRARSGSGART